MPNIDSESNSRSCPLGFECADMGACERDEITLGSFAEPEVFDVEGAVEGHILTLQEAGIKPSALKRVVDETVHDGSVIPSAETYLVVSACRGLVYAKHADTAQVLALAQVVDNTPQATVDWVRRQFDEPQR